MVLHPAFYRYQTFYVSLPNYDAQDTTHCELCMQHIFRVNPQATPQACRFTCARKSITCSLSTISTVPTPPTSLMTFFFFEIISSEKSATPPTERSRVRRKKFLQQGRHTSTLHGRHQQRFAHPQQVPLSTGKELSMSRARWRRYLHRPHLGERAMKKSSPLVVEEYKASHP